jgi:hypothetical protein
MYFERILGLQILVGALELIGMKGYIQGGFVRESSKLKRMRNV